MWVCCGLYSKSTTSPPQIELMEFGFRQVVDLSWRCSQSQRAVASRNDPIRHYTPRHIAQMEVINENAKYLQPHHSLMRNHNKPTLWGSNLKNELAWYRLSSTFNNPAGLTWFIYVNHRYNNLYCPVLTLIQSLNLTPLLTKPSP